MAKLTPEAMERVRQAILEQCPDLEGIEPKVDIKTPAAGGREAPDTLFVLTFRQQVELEDGSRMTRIVRVTADGEGQVIKLTVSR